MEHPSRYLHCGSTTCEVDISTGGDTYTQQNPMTFAKRDVSLRETDNSVMVRIKVTQYYENTKM